MTRNGSDYSTVNAAAAFAVAGDCWRGALNCLDRPECLEKVAALRRCCRG